MGICIEVGLRNSISTALKYDGDTVNIESLVSEELPGDSPFLTSAQRYARRMIWYQEYCESAGSSRNCRKDSHGSTEAITIKKRSKNERTSRSNDVLAGKNDSIRNSPITGREPFTER